MALIVLVLNQLLKTIIKYIVSVVQIDTCLLM
jgi:hypothetical protein